MKFLSKLSITRDGGNKCVPAYLLFSLLLLERPRPEKVDLNTNLHNHISIVSAVPDNINYQTKNKLYITSTFSITISITINIKSASDKAMIAVQFSTIRQMTLQVLVWIGKYLCTYVGQ